MGTTHARMDFTRKMAGMIREARAEADRIHGKLGQLGAEARAYGQMQVAWLLSKVAATEAKLHQLYGADEARFEQAKADVERSWNEVRQSVEQAAARIDP